MVRLGLRQGTGADFSGEGRGRYRGGGTVLHSGERATRPAAWLVRQLVTNYTCPNQSFGQARRSFVTYTLDPHRPCQHAARASTVTWRPSQRCDTENTICIGSRGWLDSRVVSVLDSGAEGPRFKAQSRRCRVTVVGKLFAPIVPPFTMQQNW